MVGAGGAVPAAELAAIENFYNTLYDPDKGWPPANWMVGDPCDDEWEGVFCKNGKIWQIRIYVKAKPVKVPDLTAITGLEYLHLFFSGVTGISPNALPLGFKSLDLGKCDLSDGFPDIFYLNSSMRVLQLHWSGMGGTLPSLYGLTRLMRLHVGRNGIGGAFPNPLPGKLTDIEIFENQFTGTLPESAFATKLRAEENAFFGTLPVYPEMRYLYLKNNNLIGTVNFDAYPHAIVMEISRNNFDGTLPATWYEPLRYVYAYQNQFSGTVPLTWQPNTIRRLFFTKNKLVGKLPSNAYFDSVVGRGINNDWGYVFTHNCFGMLDFVLCFLATFFHRLRQSIPERILVVWRHQLQEPQECVSRHSLPHRPDQCLSECHPRHLWH